MPPRKPSTAEAAAARERARTLTHILTVTLDKVPGLRQALPRLHELETALRERGVAALAEAPLPGYEEIRAAIARLAPDDSPELQTARAQLLASLDRRAGPRPRTLSTIVSDDELFVAEISISQFMDALDVPAPRR
jgi:hypothetical protein